MVGVRGSLDRSAGFYCRALVFECGAQGKNPPYAEDFEYDDEDHRRGFGGMSRKNEECEMRNDELGVWSGALAFFGSFGLIVQSYIQLAISN